MAIAYEICRKKTGNATYTLANKNGQEVVNKTIQVTYRVHAYDDLTPAPQIGFGPASVDEDMVRNAPSMTPSTPTFDNTLPKVGDSVYITPENEVHYWWRCTALSVTRNSANGLEFSVSCTFTDTTGKNAGQTPPIAVDEIPPIITYEAQQNEVTAWTEDGTVTAPKPCVLPTGTLYSNPPVKVVADQVITFSQYEAAFGPETMFGRIYRLNKTAWTVVAGVSGSFNIVEPRHAMITDISYEDTTVPILVGIVPTPTPCYRVTYTIHVRDWTLKNLIDDGTTSDIDLGWDQPRVRADTRYLNSSRELKPSSNFGTWGHQQLYLMKDSPVGQAGGRSGGLPFDQNLQNGIPPYDVLRIQPEIPFSFLR